MPQRVVPLDGRPNAIEPSPFSTRRHLFLQDENIELLADHFCGRDHFPYQTPRNRKTNQVELARNYREWIIGRRGPGVHAMQQLG